MSDIIAVIGFLRADCDCAEGIVYQGMRREGREEGMNGFIQTRGRPAKASSSAFSASTDKSPSASPKKRGRPSSSGMKTSSKKASPKKASPKKASPKKAAKVTI